MNTNLQVVFNASKITRFASIYANPKGYSIQLIETTLIREEDDYWFKVIDEKNGLFSVNNVIDKLDEYCNEYIINPFKIMIVHEPNILYEQVKKRYHKKQTNNITCYVYRFQIVLNRAMLTLSSLINDHRLVFTKNFDLSELDNYDPEKPEFSVSLWNLLSLCNTINPISGELMKFSELELTKEPTK